MNNIAYADQLDSVCRLFASSRIGDISSMAELLTGLEALSIAANNAGYQTQGTAAHECEELVQKIIMDNADCASEALESVDKIIMEIRSCGSDPDLASKSELTLEINSTDENADLAPSRQTREANILVDDEIVREFSENNIAGLLEVEASILRIEKSKASDNDLGIIRRCFHTIKGEAGFIGLDNVQAVCHSTEDLLDQIDPQKCTDVLLSVVDWLRTAIKGLASGCDSANSTDGILGKIAAAAETMTRPEVGPKNHNNSNSEESNTGSIRRESGSNGIRTDLPPDCGYWSLIGDTSLLSDFISESKEHLEAANSELLNLEVNADNQEAMDAVFRAFHTIKGTAGFLDLVEMQHLAHEAENLLDRFLHQQRGGVDRRQRQGVMLEQEQRV